jgi:hypothetical protein
MKEVEMSWIIEHRRVWGIAILALLLLAMMGPWAYDQINVPAEYPCSAPWIRLEGDFCGLPYSGMQMLSNLLGALISLAVGTATGSMAITDLGHTIPTILLMLCVLLPVVSALVWVTSGRQQQASIFHLAAWGLAVVFVVWMLPHISAFRAEQLWGLWLYSALVCGGLILAGVALAVRGRDRQVR